MLKNSLFDIAKLYDIAAIYGPDNKDSVRALINNVFENDNRFFSDFKESIDMMISHLKRCFTAALRVSEMSRGELVIDKSQAEQDEIIKRLLLDLSELMTQIELTTTYFPESMIETVRNTTLPLFMGNVYSLMIGPVKSLWLPKSLIRNELETIR